MAKGGARPNSGPKKGSKHKKTLEQERQRELFNQKVDAKWADLIDKQIEEGLIDPKIGQYILNQRMGRAKESIEHSGAVTLEDAYKKAAEEEDKE